MDEKVSFNGARSTRPDAVVTLAVVACVFLCLGGALYLVPQILQILLDEGPLREASFEYLFESLSFFLFFCGLGFAFVMAAKHFESVSANRKDGGERPNPTQG